MSYSIISILGLIINFIINHEPFKNIKIRADEPGKDKKLEVCRGHFLLAATGYFIADIGWGILYEYRNVDAVYRFLYCNTVLYFLFVFATVLAWTRYIVAFLRRGGRRSKLFLYTVWTMFGLSVILLIVNFFKPFIFYYDAQRNYVTAPGRHIAFIVQVVLYMMVSAYVFWIARKIKGVEKQRYYAVGLTCILMNVFLVLQLLDPNQPYYAAGVIIGICVIKSFVEAVEKKEKIIYDNIATSLAEDYEAMYYIDIETGEYREFSRSAEYASMNVPVGGRDFYAETRENVQKYVHPDDREFATRMYEKETLKEKLGEKNSYSYKYRVMVGGESKYFLFTVLRAADDKHFVLYEKDIDDELTAEKMRLENQKDHVTFSQIAEILAVNYDVIYYVDAKDSSYISYECRNIYGDLSLPKSGDDFFADTQRDIELIIHRSDRDAVLKFVDKDHVKRAMKSQRSISMDYRVIAYRKTHYVRMTIRKSTNGTHYIIGIENTDDEVKKEKQYLKALNTEKELARRDELTGVKNKNAYHELEKSVQTSIDKGMDFLTFGFVVCDANNLKKINDTEGHVAGDEYIKKTALLLCDIFAHSPVFRVGGDEFVVFLSGNDYVNREMLMAKLRTQVEANLQTGSGPVLASGMAEYMPDEDSLVADIFDRADKEMYDNKQALKKKEKAT